VSKTPLKPEVLYTGKFVQLVRDGRWEYVSRVNAKGAVFVLAITAARELILVEQFRVPVQARTLELPAGIYGDADSPDGETPEACALRELEEEAGYTGSSARVLIKGPVAPGLTSEMLFLVEATGLTKTGAGGGVGGEDIKVHVVPLAQIREWLARKAADGMLVEPRIYTGLYFLAPEFGR
jgi:ADP-ribose pyrophosphatase